MHRKSPDSEVDRSLATRRVKRSGNAFYLNPDIGKLFEKLLSNLLWDDD